MAENQDFDTRSSVAMFLISLVTGAISIYAGAFIVLGSASFQTAILAALIGSAVWGLISFFMGWIPFFGSLITLAVWLGVINLLFSGGWWVAAQIAIFAWLASLIVVYIAGAAGIRRENAMGVPGT